MGKGIFHVSLSKERKNEMLTVTWDWVINCTKILMFQRACIVAD